MIDYRVCLSQYVSMKTFSFQIQLKSVQMFTSVVQHFGKNQAGGFIKGFAPKLTEYLVGVQQKIAVVDDELNIIIASLSAFESLMPCAVEDKSEFIFTVMCNI